MTLMQTDNWAKLLKMYFSLEVSTEFLNLADSLLSAVFERETAIKITTDIVFYWSARDGVFIQSAIPVYSPLSGQVVNLPNGRLALYSKMSAQVTFKYGILKVFICWKSKTGLSYTPGATNIDPADIEFWFEGLDAKKCHSYNNPDLANLIVWPDLFAEDLQNKLNVKMSISFIECMNGQLTPVFEKTSGLKVKNLILLFVDKNHPFYYEKSETSKISIVLNVNANHNDIDILWKSKSGKIYDIADADIDCNDIEFWFGNLDIIEYQKQMDPYGYTLPFKLKNLSYNLIVNRIQIECYVTLQLKTAETKNAGKYALGMEDFITTYNDRALKNKDSGVIHNCNYNINENVIAFHIDIGSVGADFFKKLFKYLSDLNVFEKVIVD